MDEHGDIVAGWRKREGGRGKKGRIGQTIDGNLRSIRGGFVSGF
jgi:hypothetical protein